MKKVLMIVFHFYPDLEVGAVRSVKFAKYLQDFGWQPVVLTVKQNYYDNLDTTPEKFSFLIKRTPVFPNPRMIYLSIKKLIKGEKKALPQSANQTSVFDTSQDNCPEMVQPFWKRFLSSFSWTPDDKSGWILSSLPEALELIKNEKVDVLYSSGPPWTCHLLALVLKKLTGKPWVADFRDPWTIVPKAPEVSTTLSTAFEVWTEKKVLKNASRLVYVTQELAEATKEKYPGYIEGKSALIPNGYDEADYPPEPADTPIRDGRFLILYTGTLYADRYPNPVFEALGQAIRDGKISRERICLKFYGKVEIDKEKLFEPIQRLDLDGVVEFHPSVTRAEYFELISQADLLLLLQSEKSKFQIPAKAFDYIGSGKEILALISPGATERLLRFLNIGRIVNSGSVDTRKLEDILLELYNNKTRGIVLKSRDSKLIAGLSRKRETLVLSQLFNEVCR